MNLDNYRIKFIIGIVAFLVGHNLTNAQENKHEFSVNGGSTINLVSHGLNNDDTRSKLGAIVGISYGYYINDNWSIGVGVDYQTYRSSISFDNVNERYNTTDFDGDPFQFRYNVKNYKENLEIDNLNFPITIQYETSKGNTRFYALGGVKAGFILNSTYQTNIEQLETSGYYEQYDALLNDPKFMGFGTFEDVDISNQDLDTKMAWYSTFEVGIKHYLNKKNAFYVGLFFDTGLNSILSQKKGEVIEYPTNESPVILKYNSVTQSENSEKLRFSAFGFKVRFAFLN
ncbi:outer membrane beta-barrel protein [Joostella sp.]|uniref:outer membrane beta-barrel protein n=1 Tax=Joostella sp. TaxID=2231138 RepID=UPI003A91A385